MYRKGSDSQESGAAARKEDFKNRGKTPQAARDKRFELFKQSSQKKLWSNFQTRRRLSSEMSGDGLPTLSTVTSTTFEELNENIAGFLSQKSDIGEVYELLSLIPFSEKLFENLKNSIRVNRELVLQEFVGEKTLLGFAATYKNYEFTRFLVDEMKANCNLQYGKEKELPLDSIFYDDSFKSEKDLECLRFLLDRTALNPEILENLAQTVMSCLKHEYSEVLQDFYMAEIAPKFSQFGLQAPEIDAQMQCEGFDELAEMVVGMDIEEEDNDVFAKDDSSNPQSPMVSDSDSKEVDGDGGIQLTSFRTLSDSSQHGRPGPSF